MSNKPSATKENFALPSHLKFKRHLGSGAYGVVCACDDERNDMEVAVKRISNVFDRKILTKRALREITLQNHFNGHENIISIMDVFKLMDDKSFNEVYVVQELMEADMHQIIRSRQKLTNQHYQYFLYQMLRGIKYIHSAGVFYNFISFFLFPISFFFLLFSFFFFFSFFRRCVLMFLCSNKGSAPRPQARQLACQFRLLPQDLRFWAGTWAVSST